MSVTFAPRKAVLILAMVYVLWNNMIPQPPMPYWLKSFQNKPNPVPGTNFSVEQINQRACRINRAKGRGSRIVPLVSDGIFIAVSLVWAWCSDGILKGRRWPFIYADAIITVSWGLASSASLPLEPRSRCLSRSSSSRCTRASPVTSPSTGS